MSLKYKDSHFIPIGLTWRWEELFGPHKSYQQKMGTLGIFHPTDTNYFTPVGLCRYTVWERRWTLMPQLTHVIGKETKRLVLFLMNSWVALRNVFNMTYFRIITFSLLTQFKSYSKSNMNYLARIKQTLKKLWKTHQPKFWFGSEPSPPTKPRKPHPARRCRGDVWKPRQRWAINPGASGQIHH